MHYVMPVNLIKNKTLASPTAIFLKNVLQIPFTCLYWDELIAWTFNHIYRIVVGKANLRGASIKWMQAIEMDGKQLTF